MQILTKKAIGKKIQQIILDEFELVIVLSDGQYLCFSANIDTGNGQAFIQADVAASEQIKKKSEINLDAWTI